MSVILRTRNNLSVSVPCFQNNAAQARRRIQNESIIAPPKITYHAVGVLDTKDNLCLMLEAAAMSLPSVVGAINAWLLVKSVFGTLLGVQK